MPRKPTDKQQRVLDYLRREIARRGRAPSLREAARALGISHTAVAQTLEVLAEKGCLRREERYSRTIHLLDGGRKSAGAHRWREIPVIGRVTAGLPMYAQQEWDGALVVDAGVYSGENLFALTVRGDSMRDAGILDGDLAVCEPRQYARNGEIVVALIRNEEATVKRFFLRGDRIELRPENPRYSAMDYDFGEILIQGKVVGIHRGPDGIDHRTG